MTDQHVTVTSTRPAPDSGPLVTIRGLVKHFSTRSARFRKDKRRVKAVDGVDLDITRGETVGLVGESGSGKTTVGRSIIRLVEPTAGSVEFEGIRVDLAGRRKLKALRRDMQMIFQDPGSALDPRKTIAHSIAEGPLLHGLNATERADLVDEMLEAVGLDRRFRNSHPHELSGGQLQRVGIARALALKPKFLVCDEPVSALDVSIQAQIINLFSDLQDRFDLTYLFIAHDLKIVEHIADRVAVMYLGRLVEIADTYSLFSDPKHPYTRALLSAIPQKTDARRRKRIILEGEIPSAIDPPSGCRFRTRCPLATEQCLAEPELRLLDSSHIVACWHV